MHNKKLVENLIDHVQIALALNEDAVLNVSLPLGKRHKCHSVISEAFKMHNCPVQTDLLLGNPTESTVPPLTLIGPV